MTELISTAAERYAQDHTSPFAGALGAAAAWTQEKTSEPGMMSGLAEARLLEALIVVGGALRVLEIGTFTGVGTMTMAAALPEGGRITTLEVDEDRAVVAREHFAHSPHGTRIELIVGDALQSIAGLDGPFDLVYMDARKQDYPAYYDAVLPKLADRGVIVADNLFRNGTVLESGSHSAGTTAMVEFARRVQSDKAMHNTLLTVGDGIMLAWRRPADGE